MFQAKVDVHAHFIPDEYREALIAAGQDRPDGIPALPPILDRREADLTHHRLVQYIGPGGGDLLTRRYQELHVYLVASE